MPEQRDVVERADHVLGLLAEGPHSFEALMQRLDPRRTNRHIWNDTVRTLLLNGAITVRFGLLHPGDGKPVAEYWGAWRRQGV